MKRAKKGSRKAATRTVKKSRSSKPTRSGVAGLGEIKKLVHLLEVNQMELEHQNQELRITEEELEASRNKYVGLFDFSPVPYCSLEPGGVIREVNLSAGRMFGVDRSKLIGKNIIGYVSFEDKNIFNGFVKAVFDAPGKRTCEVRMINTEKRLFHVLVEGVKLDDSLESHQRCQIALIDVTGYKKLEEANKILSDELKALKAARDETIG